MHGVPTVGLRLRCDALGTGIARGTGRQWRTPIYLVLEANAEARAMAACPPPRCRVACEAVTPGRLFAHDRSRPADWREPLPVAPSRSFVEPGRTKTLIAE